MPGTFGLDDATASSSSSSSSSTIPSPQQPPDPPKEEAPTPPGEKPQVTVTLKNPNEEILKKGVTTVKPTVIKKP